MTEFKQGDRVRYSGGHKSYFDADSVGALGTVVVSYSSGNGVKVDWDKDLSVEKPSSVVFPENLEIVDDKPKVGDRVRVTIEGVVSSVDDKGFDVSTDADDPFYVLRDDKDYALEVLERAPKAYKPGTLVRSQSGPLAARTEAGHWVWLSNGRKSVVITDETVRRDYSNSIVHEPASA